MINKNSHKYFGQFSNKEYREYKKYKALNLKRNKIQLWSKTMEYQQVHNIINQHEMEKVGQCHDGDIYAQWSDQIVAIVVENDGGEFGGMIIECKEVLDTLSFMNSDDPGLLLEESVAEKVDLHDKCNYYRTHSN